MYPTYKIRRVAGALATLVAVGGLAGRCQAEISIVEGDGETEPSRTYRMTVTPAPAAVPMLKHRLLPRRIELKSGNAAPYYYRSLLGLEEVRDELEESFDNADILEEWSKKPFDELPLADVRRAMAMFDGDVMDNLAVATLRRTCDWQWQYDDARGMEALNFSLVEFQKCRELMRLLALRSRTAIADNEYDNALAAMRTNLKLSRDVSREPLLVCGLIGIAGAGLVSDALVELIAAPDSPNMYWPLATLPAPLTPLAEHAQCELELGLRMFAALEHAESAQRTAEEWNAQFRQTCDQVIALADDVSALPGDEPSANRGAPFTKFIGVGAGVLGYRHAKERLRQSGYSADALETMPVGQVLAIYSARAYQRCADELQTSWGLPYWESQKIDTDAIVERMHPFGSFEDREILPVASLLLPAVQVAQKAEMRITRDIAAIRVVEALRMHAAENGGELPETLDDIECVYVPDNPATGKPFLYRLEDGAGILDLPYDDGVVYSRRFIIRIAMEVKP